MRYLVICLLLISFQSFVPAQKPRGRINNPVYGNKSYALPQKLVINLFKKYNQIK